MATTSDGRLVTAANLFSYGLSVSTSNKTEYSCYFGMFSPIIGLSSLQILRHQDCEVYMEVGGGGGEADVTCPPPIKRLGGHSPLDLRFRRLCYNIYAIYNRRLFRILQNHDEDSESGKVNSGTVNPFGVSRLTRSVDTCVLYNIVYCYTCTSPVTQTSDCQQC